MCLALPPIPSSFPSLSPFKTKFSFPAQPIVQLRGCDVTHGLLPHNNLSDASKDTVDLCRLSLQIHEGKEATANNSLS